MSNKKFINSCKGSKSNELQIEYMSSLKGMFNNSFKRRNNKKWNLNNFPEELKIGNWEIKLFLFSVNSGIKNNFMQNNSNEIEIKAKLDDKQLESDYIDSYQKFNSVNMINSASTTNR